MNRAYFSAAAALLAVNLIALPAMAADHETKFFENIKGEWTGPGEVVAGKYKGTKFVCRFTGSPETKSAGMLLDGGCRVGVFNQKMSARIAKNGKVYAGTFMDGAKGAGLDVTGGNVDGKKAVFSLSRNQLRGAMMARLADEQSMNITVSVKVGDDMVPVIGLGLKRVDSIEVGSIKN